MKVLTSIQMREIDRKTIEGIGIPGAVLMENAGIRITQAILKRFPEVVKGRAFGSPLARGLYPRASTAEVDPRAKPRAPAAAEQNIVVVAGKGNNGGDGFVVARHLFNRGVRPTVLLLATKEEVKGDAALNLAVAGRIGVEIVETPTVAEWKKHKGGIWHASVIIDAIFGTGLIKPADGIYAAAIEDINKARAFKVAVDIPSGLSSDTHLVIGPAVKADLTVALAALKIGHILPPAEAYVGELVVADISVPPFLFDDPGLKLELVEKTTLASYFKKRKKDSHKGSYGHLFVLAGSLGKTGAAAMAARAALRTGSGLVTVGTPQSCLQAVARAMMELMTEALPETPQKTLSESALPLILDLMKGKDAVLIGPGISTHPSTAKLITSLLPKIKAPVVIDADGLNILSDHPDAMRSLPKPAVLTPHPGEFARMIGRSNQDVLDHRLELAPRFSEQFGVYLVLKGYRTLIATPEGRVFINPTGNPGMATGGSGDVLSGMIASLIIQEKDVLGATLAAVYLHGLSGDIGARKLGERALIAGDLIKYLPQALKELEIR